MILPRLWPWAAVGGVALGVVFGVSGSRLFYGSQIATLKAERAEDSRVVAVERSEALLKLHREAELASAEVLGRLDRASEVLARETARFPKENQRLTSLLLEVSARDEFSCRRRPLPESLLGGLRRSGDGETSRGGEGP